MRTVYAPGIKDDGIAEALYGNYVPCALRTGRYKLMPQPCIFGHGLESIQGAMSKLKKGVSASKIVVTI